jgi:hypothetical protein
MIAGHCEQIEHRHHEEDQRQDEAGEQEDDQRRLAAIAGGPEPVHGLVVGQRFPEIEALDHLAHERLGFVAQARPFLAFGQAGAFTRTDLLALERHRLDPRCQPVALEEHRGDGEDRCKDGDRREGGEEHLRVADDVENRREHRHGRTLRSRS